MAKSTIGVIESVYDDLLNSDRPTKAAREAAVDAFDGAKEILRSQGLDVTALYDERELGILVDHALRITIGAMSLLDPKKHKAMSEVCTLRLQLRKYVVGDC